jgi:hypothetical protein
VELASPLIAQDGSVAAQGKASDYSLSFEPARPSSLEYGHMRIFLNVVGAVLVIFGAIWFLQGINVLPGSFMTGQIRWAVYGGIAVAVGIALLLTARRTRRKT